MVLLETLVCCHCVSLVFLYSTLKLAAVLSQVSVAVFRLVLAVRFAGVEHTFAEPLTINNPRAIT